MSRVRVALVHGLILLSFTAVFIHNVVAPAGSRASLIAPRAEGIVHLRAWAAQSGVRLLTRITGTCTTWRMYSPTWRFFIWHDWYAQDPKGEWVHLDVPNLSPEYWSHRHWFKKWFWDVKESALEYHVYGLPNYRNDVAQYLCRETAEINAWKPKAIRLMRNDVTVPPPERMGSWFPLTAPVDRRYQSEYACS